MQAFQLVEPQKSAELREVPVPEPGPGQVLIKVGGAGACHTDLHLIDEADHLSGLPFTLGHENAGWVEKLGPGATGFAPGDPVLVYGPWGCGTCPHCRVGMENYCENTPGLGFPAHREEARDLEPCGLIRLERLRHGRHPGVDLDDADLRLHRDDVAHAVAEAGERLEVEALRVELQVRACVRDVREDLVEDPVEPADLDLLGSRVAQPRVAGRAELGWRQQRTQRARHDVH